MLAIYSHCSILVTLRVQVAAFDPARNGVLMPLFEEEEEEEGSRYLTKLITWKPYSLEEEESATTFSQELNSHPLALSLGGTKIRQLEKPIKKSED